MKKRITCIRPVLLVFVFSVFAFGNIQAQLVENSIPAPYKQQSKSMSVYYAGLKCSF